MLVGDLNDLQENEDIEFVIGVGVASQYSENGYIGISNNDIFEDIILDNKGWDSGKVINDVIPKLFKGNIYLPLYKYLRQNGDLDDRGKLFSSDHYNEKLTEAVSNNNIRIYYPKGKTYLNKKDEIKTNVPSFNKLVSSYNFKHVLLYIPFLEHSNLNLDDFKNFLKSNFNLENLKISDYRKMICYYDYLKHGLQIDLIPEPDTQ
uniref:hypothetical protein n=1 Tax=Pedobacter sp. TaxID=1411316 RepID=UPI003D7F8B5C